MRAHRARNLVRIKALSEGVEVSERALRAAEINLCGHELEIRVAEADVEAIKARYHGAHLEREAKRARELDRGVPRTLPGVDPRYWLP